MLPIQKHIVPNPNARMLHADFIPAPPFAHANTRTIRIDKRYVAANQQNLATHIGTW